MRPRAVGVGLGSAAPWPATGGAPTRETGIRPVRVLPSTILVGARSVAAQVAGSISFRGQHPCPHRMTRATPSRCFWKSALPPAGVLLRVLRWVAQVTGAAWSCRCASRPPSGSATAGRHDDATRATRPVGAVDCPGGAARLQEPTATEGLIDGSDRARASLPSQSGRAQGATTPLDLGSVERRILARSAHRGPCGLDARHCWSGVRDVADGGTSMVRPLGVLQR